MAIVEIKLFGEFALTVGGQQVKVRGLNERRLMALMALGFGKPLQRTQIAEALWPEADYAVSGNRLRAALSGLRKALGECDPLDSDGTTLQLNADRVKIDIEEAARLERKRQFVSSVADEAAVLDQLLRIITPNLLEGWSESWVLSTQDHWHQVRQRSLVRRAELALQMEDFEEGAEHSDAALGIQPYDEGAWSVYLVAMARLGAGAEAFRRFRTTSRRATKVGPGAFSPQLAALASSVRDGLFDPATDWPELPSGMEGALLRGLLRLLQVEPVTAARFITTDAFRLEMLRAPGASIKFLESLMLKVPEGSPERTAVEIMALRIHSVLHEVDEVISLGQRLMDGSLDPVQKRLVLSQVSFAHFLVREMDRALELIEQALVVARQHASSHHLQLTRADRALYLWHAGQDVEAQATFEEVFGAVQDLPATQVSYAPAYLSGLIGTILLWRGESGQAATWLQKGYRMAKLRRYVEQVHQVEPPLGLALAKEGSLEKGGALVISGLAHFCRSGNIRAFAASLDTMSAVFSLMNDQDAALRCFGAGTELRTKWRHARSVAETRFADSILKSAAPQTLTKRPRTDAEPSVFLEWIVQHFYRESSLRSAH